MRLRWPEALGIVFGVLGLVAGLLGVAVTGFVRLAILVGAASLLTGLFFVVRIRNVSRRDRDELIARIRVIARAREEFIRGNIRDALASIPDELKRKHDLSDFEKWFATLRREERETLMRLE